MKNITRRLALWNVLLLVAGPALAADLRAGNVLFKVPAGWKRVQQDQLVLLIPSDLAPGEGCVLTILPGQELKGDFRAWFDATREALQKDQRVVSGGEVRAQRAEEGFPTLSTAVILEDSAGKRSFRFYLAAHPGSRAEIIAYLATSQEVFQRYQPALAEFVKNANFANIQQALLARPPGSQSHRGSTSAGRRPLRPAEQRERKNQGKAVARRGAGGGRQTAATGLSGLYMGTESRQQFNVLTHFYDYIVRQVYYLFAPDGRVYYGLPQGGSLSRFSFARAQQENPNNTGTFQLSGGQIRFQWGGGRSQTLPFERQGSRIRIGRTTLYPVGRSDGLRLAGTYSSRSFTNVSAPGIEGGVSGERQISFDPSGHFSARGFVGYAGVTERGLGDVGAATSSRNSGSGSYRIADNTLELTYPDGRRERYTFFVNPETPNEKRPGLIYIDGRAYLLRQ